VGQEDNAEVILKVANDYHHGVNVEQSITQAIFWYEKAARNRHVDAMYDIGLMYYSGDDIKKNYTKVSEWYTKAAENGSIDGIHSMGCRWVWNRTKLHQSIRMWAKRLLKTKH
jgi:TPR repeat protein